MVLFPHFLDITMTNTWKIHQIVSNIKLNQIEFHCSIIRNYLKDGATTKLHRK